MVAHDLRTHVPIVSEVLLLQCLGVRLQRVLKPTQFEALVLDVDVFGSQVTMLELVLMHVLQPFHHVRNDGNSASLGHTAHLAQVLPQAVAVTVVQNNVDVVFFFNQVPYMSLYRACTRYSDYSSLCACTRFCDN